MTACWVRPCGLKSFFASASRAASSPDASGSRARFEERRAQFALPPDELVAAFAQARVIQPEHRLEFGAFEPSGQRALVLGEHRQSPVRLPRGDSETERVWPRPLRRIESNRVACRVDEHTRDAQGTGRMNEVVRAARRDAEAQVRHRPQRGRLARFVRSVDEMQVDRARRAVSREIQDRIREWAEGLQE